LYSPTWHSNKDCLAKGVKEACTTMMARYTLSSFMRFAYSLMVFTPTFSSSGKKMKICWFNFLFFEGVWERGKGGRGEG
jgi:hypothetical protein